MDYGHIVTGVDIGGTHITAALVDTASRQVIQGSVNRRDVNAAGSADEIIAEWTLCIKEVVRQAGVQYVCIAMPGPMGYEEGISFMQGQDKYEHLYGLNIKDRLAQSLDLQRDHIFMYNDAACFLQGEVYGGSAADMQNEIVIGVTLGTGLGSAIYKRGKSQSADKWCCSFKTGIAEDYLSTRWFVRYWKELTGITINGVRELAQLVNEHHIHANQVFSEFGNNLGSFLLDFATSEEPQAIVIGGNIAKTYPLFIPFVKSIVHSRHPHILLRQATIGEHAPLLGAVSSWNYQAVKKELRDNELK